MSYIALYRQYRPQLFREIKGQNAISQTLRNALASRRLSHAYLFCGPRGTGKTSTAKILAKAANCPRIHDGEPCNVCPSCERITSGSSMDVLEIDAASNRGIDEIRDLREKVNLSPVEGSFKVYIIDEVHMLTSEAFNALLKTLEEPPRHVIFILATTDPRKIPATILSRCQRFDFRQIAMQVILTRLREVAEAAGVNVQEEALYLIARQAQGGLRDALGLLDQCLASGAKEVSLEEAAALLGAVEDELLLEFHQIASAGDIGGALLLLDRILSEGRELKQFVGDLTLFYRDLLLLGLGGQAGEIVAVASEIRKSLEAEAQKMTLAQCMSVLRILNQTENEIKWSNQARILVELGIINLVEAMGQCAATKEVAPEKEPKPARGVKPGTVIKKGAASPANQAIVDQGIALKGSVDFQFIQEQWGNFLETLRKKAHPSHEAFLREAKLSSLEGFTLICDFATEHKFHSERLEEPQVKEKVEQVLKEFFGGRLNLKCRLANEPSGNPKKQAESEIIKKAIEMFGGELVDIVDE